MTIATILMSVMAGITLGFIFATLYALRNWTGGWRWFAAAPLLYVIANVMKLVIEVRADPTSHNLWPFEMLGTLVLAFALLGGLYLVRFLMRRITQRQQG